MAEQVNPFDESIPEGTVSDKGAITASEAADIETSAHKSLHDFRDFKNELNDKISAGYEPTSEDKARIAKLDAAADEALNDLREAKRIREVQATGSDLKDTMDESRFESRQSEYSSRMNWIASKAFEGGGVKLTIMPPTFHTAGEFTPDKSVSQVGDKQFVAKSSIGLPPGVTQEQYISADSFAGTLQTFADSTSSNAPFITSPYGMYAHQMSYQGPMIRGDVIDLTYTDDTSPVEYPILGTEPAVNTTTAEGAEIADTDPTHTDVTIGTTQVDAQHEISNKLRKGSYVDIDSVIVRILRTAVGRGVNTLLTTATNARTTNNVTGIVAEAGGIYSANENRVQLVSDSGTTLGTRPVDRLKDAYGLLDTGFDIPGDTGWMTHRRTATAFDSANSENFYDLAPWYANANYDTRNPGNGMWGHWLGRPVWENPAMTVGPSADAATIAIFGNLKSYTVRMCPIEVFISEHVAASRNNLYIRVVTYVGGKRTHAAGLTNQVGPMVTIQST